MVKLLSMMEEPEVGGTALLTNGVVTLVLQ